MLSPDALYRASFEQSPTPQAVLDGRGLLAFWNPAFEELFRGIAETGPERLRGSLFEFLAERECSRFDYYAAEILLGGRDRAAMESQVRAAGGVRRWFRFSLALLEPGRPTAPGPEGARAGAAPSSSGHAGLPPASAERLILLSCEEITDRVVREKRLREAKDEAEKATNTKSQFLANMSHEIRTPIQTILGVVELLQETSLDGEQAEYAAQVRFSADVLLGLINDILDFSKIEAGKLDLETADFDLRDCVRQSADMLVMDAHRKGLEVVVDLDDSLPSVLRGDSVRLRQIIVNLFKNAVKFTKEGSISLAVSPCRTGELPGIRFQVADTGPGVPEPVRDRLFTPFFQADFALARKAGGTGLGLAISRHLVELMGGRIGVSPNAPNGSVFWFELPLAAPEHTSPPLPEPSGEGARLLVVDDHPLAREFACRLASKAGYRASAAASGEEALAALREAAASGSPFALCLIDQNMPRMDGWRLASEITGDTAINGARLVLMVPEGTMGAAAKMKLLRWFNAYVTKPLRRHELLEAMGRALQADVDLPPAESAGEEAQALPELEPVFEAKVLIAEDHEVNRELFTVLLQRLGCEVVTARDGMEAVEIGSAQDFDIVLMDIFMPRMNGYEAAEALRAAGLQVPIVAVTASALKGEREKCVAAGMDDILVKPFKKKDLSSLLGTWLPPRLGGSGPERSGGRAAAARRPGAAAASSPVAASTPSAAAASISSAAAAPEPRTTPKPPAPAPAKDAAVFDWEGVLDTFLGQEETVRGLLGRFLAKAEAQVEELATVLDKRDFGQFREVAHSMKGASWNLSARRLGDAAMAAESAGRNGDEAAAREALAAVREEFARFAAAARARLG